MPNHAAPALLELQQLAKSFGAHRAVDNVSLRVEGGDVVALLGLNGAGKTTTLRMAAGYLQPTSGRALVCGHDSIAAPLPARQHFGYVPEGAPLYGEQTVTEFLHFVAAARGIDKSARTAKCQAALSLLSLDTVKLQPIETLSKGYRRRVALAQAVLHDPSLLILDEPTDGLDPKQKNAVRDLLRNLGHDKAVLVSTHILEEVEALCNRVVVIHNGRVVLDSTPEAMRRQSRYAHAVTLTFAPQTNLAHLQKTWPSENLTLPDGRVQATFCTPTGQPILMPLLNAVQSGGIEPLDFMVENGRLTDVFASLTA